MTAIDRVRTRWAALPRWAKWVIIAGAVLMVTASGSAVNIALSQYGKKEATGNNDGADIAKFTGGRQEPWCAHFVAWVFRTAGKPIPGDVVPTPTRANPLASVTTMEEVFRKNGWLVKDPQAGDVVFFASRGGSDSGAGRHVGIVESVDTKAGIIHTIEGNFGNRVAKAAHNYRNNSNITNFGRRP